MRRYQSTVNQTTNITTGKTIKRTFISRFIKSRNTTIPINEKPLVTGNGPFVELPKFQPIDPNHPNSLLVISIPQASRLTIKNESSIIGINGDFNNLTNESCGEYSSVYSNSAVSVLINGNNRQYSIIDVQEPLEEWIVLNRENVIAWSGFLKPNFSTLLPHQLLYLSIWTFGRGKLVVNGDNELFNVELKQGEEILVNPNSLIAVNNPNIEINILGRGKDAGEETVGTRIGRSVTEWNFPKINLPKYGIMGSIFNSFRSIATRIEQAYLELFEMLGVAKFFRSIRLNSITYNVRKYLYDLGDYVNFKLLKYLINRARNRNPVYFKVKGPAKLLMNNSHYSRNIFTSKELNDIFNKF
ncbi:uncharacterized protein J8A68_000458 [[Candida] subhashii]|uniref:Altered inheritance of mitochondria protein 24, mitochondrial n=1 Tax=[Candida] subhashii TaxID=561895 RepID=A0A8J5QR67_9ASCO|nr:uncharacterized protein J8A68_000458 [[Candida] subhashii]KAG7666028.1 hypothetical protein J8A68_000458 [[Candida] subhashii]